VLIPAGRSRPLKFPHSRDTLRRYMRPDIATISISSALRGHAPAASALRTGETIDASAAPPIEHAAVANAPGLPNRLDDRGRHSKLDRRCRMRPTRRHRTIRRVNDRSPAPPRSARNPHPSPPRRARALRFDMPISLNERCERGSGNGSSFPRQSRIIHVAARALDRA